MPGLTCLSFTALGREKEIEERGVLVENLDARSQVIGLEREVSEREMKIKS